MDSIIIKNLKIYAYHGVNPEEKIDGQNFLIDTVMFIDKRDAFKKDDINKTLSYSSAAKVIKKIVTEKKYDLIETVVEKIAEALFKTFVDLEKAEITVKKPEAPMKADFEYVAVKIIREKSDYNEWSDIITRE